MSERACLALLLGLFAVGAAAAPLVDPMRPPEIVRETPEASRQSALPVLDSTLIAPGRRIATIDGRRYRAGDAVAGGTLVAIEPTGVLIERNGQRLRLDLLPSGVKRKVGQ
ncbi:MAG: general secretion pathway protein GspB [Gammaproteobacteria bacterium]|nr:general secretion pathway protein GspB [Gammaproteobacteria bacterium]